MLNWLIELVSNPFLIVSVSSWFVAQVLKTIIYVIVHREMNWERMIGDGGMPSGHSATVSSLALMCLLMCGPGSVEFAISAILAIIVCHDAMGVRLETGKQAVVINELVEAFNLMVSQDVTDAQLKELVGHTPLQVCAGILVGVVNAVVMYFCFFV